MLLADVYRCALEHHTLACVSIFRCAQLVCAVACNTARGFRFAVETLPGLVAFYGNYMMEWQCMDKTRVAWTIDAVFSVALFFLIV